MKILETKVLRGPNYWSIKKHKLIQITLDLEELEHRPSDTIAGFSERIQALLPSLYHHECSRGRPGGFFERVQDGTWMGHIVEHIALEIQTLAGIEVGFGRTRGTGKPGVYHVAFSYGEEAEGRYTAKAAVRIAGALVNGEAYDVQKDIEEIRRLWIEEKMGPTTQSIVSEAQRRGIPVLRLDEHALVQLGYGKAQRRVEASMADSTNIISVDLAGDKDATKRILTDARIPVPMGEITDSVDNLVGAISLLGFPLVVKPLDGNHGNGATIGVQSYEEAVAAFHRAKEFSQKVIIEKLITGSDFRVLVVNYKFVAAALRTPASVVGDGKRSIRELVDMINSDPKRGKEHDNVLTKISTDDVCLELLAKKGMTLDSVPHDGERVFLKPTANLSTGGTAEDVTERVHPRNRVLFERIARTIGLDICGIDIMAPDLSTPLKENGGAVIEVNAAPGLRMHLEPTMGTPRNVAEPIVDMLFPNNSNGRIPIIAVTGTNGKTTTTRLLARMVQDAGFSTGFTTTDGIYINDELIDTGDCSGPASAQLILKDRAVEFAVLECARGGLLRSGLGFDQCDTAIVTNVAEDHLGLDGIDTLDKLARVKSVLPETVKSEGYAILNADDDLVYAMKDNVSCKVALFSLHANNIRVERHCAHGGLAAIYENGYILLRQGNHIIPVEEVSNIPLTFGGKAEFNVANVLSACLAAYTNGISLATVRQTLRTFAPTNENTPGRVNMFDFNQFKIIVDYGHNPHAVRAMGQFVKNMDASVRIGIVTGVGDRRDEDIISLGEEAARVFDELIIRFDDDLRGRSQEEIDRLLQTGIRKVDHQKRVRYFPCECEAVDHFVANAPPGAVVVVFIEHVTKVLSCIKAHHEQDQQRTSNMKAAV
jgi:cyanophycin synthetase